MTLKMKNISFIAGMIVLFVLLWGAGSFTGEPDGFSGFGRTTAISPDDSELVFSYYHGDDAALYTVPVSGGEAELLAKPEEGKSFCTLRFLRMVKKLPLWSNGKQKKEGIARCGFLTGRSSR